MNELRQLGRYEELDQRIGWYLEAADPVDLYRKVIERWEQDYEEQDSGSEDIVGESMSRLWAARRGLSETELLESLGGAGSPLSHALWSPLFLAAGDALVNRGGLLTFAHNFLREAVREAYLPTKAHAQAAHRTLAVYFKALEQIFVNWMNCHGSGNRARSGGAWPPCSRSRSFSGHCGSETNLR